MNELNETPVRELLERLGDGLRRTLDPRIRVQLGLCDEGLRCLADAVELERALVEIVSNARDAMPEGGLLSLRAQAHRPVDVEAARYVAITVADNGAGMEPSVRERATTAFFTTKGHPRHGGLGLTGVSSFVQQAGGTLLIRSAPHDGTAVTMILPQA